jgi:hypothetical protein
MALRIVNNIMWWLVAIWLAGYATLGPHSGKPVDAPITVGEPLGFLGAFGGAVGLGKGTAFIASRKGGNYVGWSYYGLLLPLIALPHAVLMKAKTPGGVVTVGPSPAGRWQHLWSSIQAYRSKRSALMGRALLGLVCTVILAIALVWWWTRPAAETLTERLHRECRDTLAYTRPEWGEAQLDRATKACMTERLLLSR